MIILAEFLMACGLVAIVVSLIYSGYKIRQAQEEKKND